MPFPTLHSLNYCEKNGHTTVGESFTFKCSSFLLRSNGGAMGQSDMIEETLVLYSLCIKDFASWKQLEYQLMFTETLIFWHGSVH